MDGKVRKGNKPMNGVMDIDIITLLIGFIIMLIPIAGFWYFKVTLIKDTIIGLIRMTVQLSLVALYLEYIFKWNNPLVNSLWVMVMIVVGVHTSIKRIKLNFRLFWLPFLISGITSLIIVDAFFLGFVIRLDNVFETRYFIPISGMILGNAMNHNIVGLTTYLEGLSKERNLYQFLLINTNSRKSALASFVREALRRGLNPLIATMTVMGLISLPGMMTGQILGGSSPVVAIKYQIMILLAIFAGSSINLLFSIMLANSFIFDKYHRLKPDIFSNNSIFFKNRKS